MELLVTGGSGFIGSNFIRYWLEKYPNDRITNLDKLTYAGNLENNKDYANNKNYQFIKGDICDATLVDTLMKDAEIVVHFAAETHVDRSIEDPQVFLKTNILGTQVLLEAAKKYKIKHFHHISTDEVYGELELGKNKQFTEDTNYDPRSPYAAAKAASDHLVNAYFHTYKLPITITNCSNNYGPYQDPEKFIPRSITNLIRGEPIKLYGDGEYVRDWLHVDDHVRAIALVIKKGTIGETYLVGGQKTEEISNKYIAEEISKMMGKNDKKSIVYVKDRPGHDRKYAVDWSKINKELGWEPKAEFKEWLNETINWYIDNEPYWSKLKIKTEEFYAKIKR